MVRKDPTQQIVIVLSALLFLAITGVTVAQRMATAPISPDPITTYGTSGK